jgi:hypothetical protein
MCLLSTHRKSFCNSFVEYGELKMVEWDFGYSPDLVERSLALIRDKGTYFEILLDGTVVLDGTFTADELKVIIAAMPPLS